MKSLNDNIKVIGVEAIAGCMLLLANTEDKNRECLTISFDRSNGPAYPMGNVMLIDRATTFNAFDGFKNEKESEQMKTLLTQRLSDDHIDEVNTLLANKELIEYISFEGSSLTKYAAERFKSNEINAEYVIERYRLPDHQFFYKIFRRHTEEFHIYVGDWRITNIRSANHVDRALYFDLIDPKGKSSEDQSLPYYWVIEGAECNLFSRAIHKDPTGLSDMLNLAHEAARFDNWLDFIKHKFAAIVLQEPTLKIEMLTQEVNSFKLNLFNLIKSF